MLKNVKIFIIYYYVAISQDGLLCQAREQRQWQGARSTYGVTEGEVLF